MATQTTGGGSTTSFTNTPQAKDDNYNFTEDELLANGLLYNQTTKTIFLDVMSNDLGGNAKSLFSIDDGGTDAMSELLKSNVTTSWERTADGNWIRICNGKIEYRIDDGSHTAGSARDVNSLNAGECIEDSFVYAIRLGNGTLAWATVTIKLTGTNDLASISGQASGGVTEDGNGVTTFQTVSGTLTVIDPDSGQNELQPLAAGTASDHGYGTFQVNANGTWTYTLTNGNSAVQALAQGEHLTDTITVTSEDGTATQVITVTIYGTNDAPDISVGAGDSASAGLNETDGGLMTSGTLTVSDVDTSDVVDISVTGVSVGGTGGTGGIDNATLLAMLSLSGNDDNAADGTLGSLGWNFNSGGEAFNYLAAGETLVLTYTLSASDGHGGSDTQTVTITITGTNDAPTVSDVLAVADEDGASVLGSFSGDDVDSDDDGASLTYAITSDPSEGSAVNNGDGTFTFDPGSDFQDLAEGETRQVTFGYTATDSHGVVSNTGTVTVTVTGTNDAPTVSDVLAVADEDGASVLGSFSGDDVDSDDDGASLTYAITSDPSEGSAVNNGDGTFTFDPGSDFQDLAEGETRQVTFGYTATDSHGVVSNTGTVTVTVTGTNDAPTVSDVLAVADEDGASVLGSFSGDDVDSDDDGASLTYAITSDPSEGSAVNNGDGTFTFDPGSDFQDLAEGETRQVTFGYTATDSHGVVSNTGTVTVTVTGTNDAPDISVGAGDSASAGVNETDGGLMTSGTLTVSDVDTSDVVDISVTGVSVGGTGGTGGIDNATLLAMLSLSGNDDNAADGTLGSLGWNFNSGGEAFNYLAAGETLVLTYTLSASDGHGGSDTQTVTVTITGTNDAPVTGGDDSASGSEDDASIGGTVPTATDVDGDPLSYVLVTGSVEIDGNPAPDGTVTLNADGTYSYNPSGDQDLDDGESRTITFRYVASDGDANSDEATVTITVNGADDAPTLGAVASGSIAEDVLSSSTTSSGLSGTLNGNDVDSGDTLTYGIDGGTPGIYSVGGDSYDVARAGSYGTLYVDSATGAYVFVPDAAAIEALDDGDSDNDVFTVSVNDGDGPDVTQTYTVNVSGANDAPVITDLPGQSPYAAILTYTDTAADDSFSNMTGTIVATDPDADDILTFSIDGGVTDNSMAGYDLSKVSTFGTLYLNSATGAYKFVPNDAAIEGQTGPASASFSVVVTDLHGATDSAVVSVQINGANDTASITAQAGGDYNVTEAGGVANGTPGDPSASGQVNVSDRDSGQSSFQTPSSLDGTYGTFTFNASTGQWTYALDNSRTATQALNTTSAVTDTLTVTSLDGSASHNIVVNVAGANDAAVITGATSGSITEDAVPNTVGGNLNSTDVDNPNDSWTVVSSPTASTNGYGSFTIDASGNWVYTLNNGNSTVNALNNGGVLSDSFTVTTIDGTQQVVSITINGHTDAFVYTSPPIYTGTGDPNDFDNLGNPAGQTITGTNGDDVIYGGAGNDTINGGNGDDVIYAGSGNDTVNGENQGDHLYGGSGNDTLFGGNQNDHLIGGYGADTLTGGNGSDIFYYLSNRDTGDTITDFSSAQGDKIDLGALGLTGAGFIGGLSGAGAVGAGQFGYLYNSTTNTTTIYVDTDGVFGADLEIHLTGNIALSGTDFLFGGP